MMLLALSLLQDPHDWIRARVRDLGSEDYAVREKATADLKALQEELHAALVEAEKSRDPEVAARARQLREAPYVALPIKAHSTQKSGTFTVEYDCVPSEGPFYGKIRGPKVARIVIVDDKGRTAEVKPTGSTFTPPRDFGHPAEMRLWTER